MTVRHIKRGLLALAAAPVIAAAGLASPVAVHAQVSCTDSWTGLADGVSWSQAGNWSTNAVPVSTDNVCITAASAPVVLDGTAPVTVNTLTLGGAGGGTQTLVISGGTASEVTPGTAPAALTVTDGNDSLIATNGDLQLSSTDADNASFAVHSGSLTNQGTIEALAGGGGSRSVSGGVTNTGSVSADAGAALTWAGGMLDNQGSVGSAATGAFTANPGATVNNDTGGSLVANGSLTLSGNTLQGAGTTSGTNAVVQQGGLLDYTGTGAGSITAVGLVTLEGNIASGQTLTIQQVDPKCVSPANTSVAAQTAFTNAGTIDLVADGCAGDKASLNLVSALSNHGTIESTGSGATKLGVLNGSVTNAATANLNVGAGTRLEVTDLTNNNLITDSLNGGNYTVAGTLVLDGSFIQQLKANVDLLAGGNIQDQFNNSFRAGLQTVLKGGVLAIDGATASFTGGALTNNGTLTLENGGNLSDTSALTNTGKLTVGDDSTLTVAGFSQSAKGTTTFGVGGTTAGSGYGQIVSSGTDTLGGNLAVTLGTFTPTLGNTFQVLSDSGATGQFAKISGNVFGTGDYLVPAYTSGVVLSANQVGALLTPATGSTSGNTPFTVTGSGFSPGETVTITFGGTALTPAVADGSGNINQAEAVPSGLTPGKVKVILAGQTSLIKLTLKFNVTA